jgi:hypothetical protein
MATAIGTGLGSAALDLFRDEATPIGPSSHPAPPIQTTSTSGPRQPGPDRVRVTGQCVSHEKAEELIGLRLQPYGESCLFVRADAGEQKATCPPLWVCTWHEPSGVTVRQGAGQTAVVGQASSRYVPAYPLEDRVRDICQWLLVERREHPEAKYVPARDQLPCP